MFDTTTRESIMPAPTEPDSATKRALGMEKDGFRRLAEQTAKWVEELRVTEARTEKAIAFEQLFPDSKYEDLRLLNPINLKKLIQQWADANRRKERMSKGEVFTERVEMSDPDRMTVTNEMAEMKPSDLELPPGAFEKLLKEGEQLGKVCEKLVIVQRSNGPLGTGNQLGVARGHAVGVKGPDGSPRAYIFFTGGPPLAETAPRPAGPTTATARPVSAPAGA